MKTRKFKKGDRVIRTGSLFRGEIGTVVKTSSYPYKRPDEEYIVHLRFDNNDKWHGDPFKSSSSRVALLDPNEEYRFEMDAGGGL